MIREKSNNARKEFAELMNKHERSKRNIGQEVPAEIVKKDPMLPPSGRTSNKFSLRDKVISREKASLPLVSQVMVTSKPDESENIATEESNENKLINEFNQKLRLNNRGNSKETTQNRLNYSKGIINPSFQMDSQKRKPCYGSLTKTVANPEACEFLSKLIRPSNKN